MDEDLKALVEDLLAFDPEDTAHKRAELSDAHAACGKAVKAILDPVKGDIEKLDGVATDTVTNLLNKQDAIKARVDKLPTAASIKARIAAATAAATQPTRKPAYAGASREVSGTGYETKSETIEATEDEDEKFILNSPFKSFAHFAMEVRRAGPQPGLTSQGLLGEWNSRVNKIDRAVKAMPDDQKALSGLGELADDEGAAFVPTQIAASIFERSKEMVDLMAMADNTPVAGNNLTVKAWNDKSASSHYYGGAIAYWGAEGQQLTSSKPKTRDINLKLNKLHVLFYASSELLEDAPALNSELTKIAAYALTRKRNEAVIRGTGAGQPIGLLNAAAKVTVAAVSGQGANTITATNINAMWSRRAPDSESRCVWLYIIDAEPQFAQANYAIANATAATYVYIPAGGLSARGYDTLKGRRMIETSHCSALGTEGDIILWDPMSYKVISKSSGVNQAASLHLRFDYDEVAFRWTQRVDGQPLWDAAFTPERGNTRSPIVTLHSTRI